MSPRASRIVVLACPLALSAPGLLLAADPPIQDLAPPSTFLLVTIPDATEFRRSFEASRFGQLWREPAVREFLAALANEVAGSESIESDMGEWLDGIGYDRDAVHWPTGPMGMAAFLEPDRGPDGDGADRGGSDRSHVLLAADFGENADAVFGAVTAVLERAESRSTITLDRIELGSVQVFELKRPIPDPEAPPGGEEAGDEGEYVPTPEPSDVDLALEHMFVARASSTVLACTSREAMEAALERVAGKGGEVLSSGPDVDRAMRSLGEANDAALAVFAGPIRATSEKLRAEPAEGQEFNDYWIEGPLASGAIGLSSAFDPPGATMVGSDAISCFAAGLDLVHEDFATEMRASLLLDEKRGVFKLLADAQGPIMIPAAVPADAAGVFAVRVPFDRVLGAVRDAFQALPEDERKAALAQLSLAEGVAAPVLNELGPDATLVQSIRRPLASDSSSYAGVIKLKDPTPLTTLVTTYGVQAGFQPRDFEGNTIYETSLQPFKIALGMTAGNAVIGPPEQVENLLRGMGRADATPHAFPGVPGWGSPGDSNAHAVAYSFSDTRQGLEEAYWAFQNRDQVLARQLEEWGVPEEEREGYMAAMDSGYPEAFSKLPDSELLLKHFGDSVWVAFATPEGFAVRAVMLHPRE